MYAHEHGIQNIKLEEGNYYVSAEYEYITANPTVKRKTAIVAQSDVIFNLNGSTITLVANSLPRYTVILIKDVSNFEITNGIVKGDRDFHTCGDGSLLRTNVLSNGITQCSSDSLKTHEWGHVFHINSSSNITVSDLEIADATGDGLAISDVNIVNIVNNDIRYIRRNGISIISGDYITIDNNEIHDITGTDPQAGIDIEKNYFDQLYSNITIKNNKIYNTVSKSIRVFNKIYRLTINNNEMTSNITARVKPRKALDASDSDEFPTNADAAYLMNKYSIQIYGNTVMASENIPSEHREYDITVTDENVNVLNYSAYIHVISIRETNNAKEYNLKKNATKTIPVTWSPPGPTYKILSYESSDTSIATVSSGKITAKKEGTAVITVRAIDYGADPSNTNDDKTYSFEITVNVTK